jgi:hypothetical protein
MPMEREKVMKNQRRSEKRIGGKKSFVQPGNFMSAFKQSSMLVINASFFCNELPYYLTLRYETHL